MTDLSGRLASQGGRRLVRRLKLARAALLWERVWPAAWPALCVLGGFAVLALFDLLPWLPGAVHAGVLAGLGVPFFGAVRLGVPPRPGDARLADPVPGAPRVELASGAPA